MARHEVLGLSVKDERLWLRANRRRGARIRLEPTGLVVATRDERLFGWDSCLDGRYTTDGWRCSGHPASRSNRAAVSVYHERRAAQTFEFPHVQEWSVPAPWLSLRFAWAELPALVAYLVATPTARDALNDTERLDRLIAELQSGPIFERWPPEHHMMGDKLDIDLAIERVFKDAGVRRFNGRPVRGEPLPSLSELVPLVRGELPPWVRERANDPQIERQVERLLGVRPWPFDCLMPDA